MTANILIGLEQAYALLQAAVAKNRPKVKGERLLLDRALGRYLAEPVTCGLDHPSFDQAAMDGIAFRWQSGLSRLRLLGTVAAGDPPMKTPLGFGEAFRIMTGAPIPQGADSVMMIEKVRIDGDNCFLEEPATKGQHIRFQGENLKKGTLLAKTNTCVTTGRLAAFAAQGTRFLNVKPKLGLGLATTGNEVVPYYQPLQPGQVHNSNAPALQALFTAPDVTLLQLGVLPDQLALTQASLAHQTDLDVLILTGGVSMGAFDYVPAAAEAAGFKRLFHKVKMKPGKPIWVGRHPSGTWLFGLPGNPVSALVGAVLFIQPILNACRTGQFQTPRWLKLPLGAAAQNRSKFDFFQGACLVDSGSGTVAQPMQTSGSGDIVRFGGAETLMRLPPGADLAVGSGVEVLLPSHLVIG